MLADTSDSPLPREEVAEMNLNLAEMLGISPLKLSMDGENSINKEPVPSSLSKELSPTAENFEALDRKMDADTPKVEKQPGDLPSSPLPSSYGPSPQAVRQLGTA